MNEEQLKNLTLTLVRKRYIDISDENLINITRPLKGERRNTALDILIVNKLNENNKKIFGSTIKYLDQQHIGKIL
jgi:hypothetical protein